MIINNEAPVDEAFVLRNFPNIDIEGFIVTSDLNPTYNCFAWAGNDDTKCWLPFKSKYYFWYTDNTALTLENVINNYSHIGYTEITESSDLEEGYDKVAIYIDEGGEPSHAARQVENGKWTSKLGDREDIEHSTPECLESDSYGKVKVILKRPKKYKQSSTKEENFNEFENFKNLAKGIANVPKKRN